MRLHRIFMGLNPISSTKLGCVTNWKRYETFNLARKLCGFESHRILHLQRAGSMARYDGCNPLDGSSILPWPSKKVIMTEKQKEFTKCPHCDSMDLEFIGVFDDGHRKIYCNNCYRISMGVKHSTWISVQR